MTVGAALSKLEAAADPMHKAGLSRYAIPNAQALGVRMPDIRKIGKSIGKDQRLAEQLWEQPVHEAKHLAIAIAEPGQIKKETLNRWTDAIYSWDLCDHLCDVTSRTAFRMEVAEAWRQSDKVFVRRSGIVILISIILHDKKLNDAEVLPFLDIVEQEAWDDRNFIKKAVNWLLRQIGKRSLYLNLQAIACGEKLLTHPDPSAHWIAKDALKELRTEAVQDRLKKKAERKK